MDEEEDPLLGYVRGERPAAYDRLVRPCLAEFVGTMIFVFIGTMSAQNTEAISVALGHGLVLALIVAAFGGISGAHVNPAVTLAVCLSGGLKWMLAIFYVICQLLGAITGAAVTRGILSHFGNAYINIKGGGFALPDGISPEVAVLCEIALTFILVLTILMVAVDTDSCVVAPLAIGFALASDILAGGNISGASMNPARSFGPAVAASGLVDLWPNHWIYWVAPVSGALLATLFYKLLFAHPTRRLILKQQ